MTVVERVGSAVVQNFERAPLYHLDSGVPTRREVTVEEARQQPSLLLNAQHQQIEFIGRTSELWSMTQWREAENQAAALLVHGPGGQGKSRLAAEFARKSREAGWTVLQVHHGSDRVSRARANPTRPGPVPAEHREGEHLLLVLDYAERWPSQDLVDFMDDCAKQNVHTLRVLLIARPASAWWFGTRRSVKELGFLESRMFLPPLTAELDRKALFRNARDSFASALGADGAAFPRTSRDLSGEGFSTVLALHMAALAEADALRTRKTPPGTPAEITEYLLSREYAYWEKLQLNGRVRIPPAAFSQTVYTATLTGALPYRQGLEAVARIGVESTEHEGQILRDHALAYPSQGQEAVLEPLYPDILGEDFIAFLLPQGLLDEGHDGSLLADPWATEAPARLISGGADSDVLPEPGPPDPWVRRTLITLIESARRWDHVARRQIAPLLSTHGTLVQRVGPAALAALTRVKALPPETLDAFESALPFRDVEIDTGAAELARHLAPYRLKHAPDDKARAAVHSHLSIRLYHAGDYGAATHEIEKVLLIHDGLARRDPAHLPVLAHYLDWAGIIYSHNGGRDEALDATRRAVGIYTELVQGGGDEYRSSLGYALANLTARDLSAEERRSYAHAAVDIGRALAGDDPTRDGVELAGALHNLAHALWDLGRDDEALDTLREAADIRRAQAGRKYGFYAPYLHVVLGPLTSLLVMKDHLDEARGVAREHVTLLRDLSRMNPVVFASDLTHAELVLEVLTDGPD